MSKYTHTEQDAWRWRRAIHTDVEQIVALADQHFAAEITEVFEKSTTRLAYYLHSAILNMHYGLNQHLITVAVIDDRVVAWAWIERGKYQVYANEEMAVAEFAHVDLSLSTRTRMCLVAQTIESWILWCELNHIPVLCSTSIREDQAGFMRLHDQFGFTRRGSFAYRKIGD